MVSNFAARLETAGTDYRLFPVVHVSKLKPVRMFPDRPTVTLTAGNEDRLDFDEALLPEDSWDKELEEGEYEVERIGDMRTGRRTRYGRTLREFQVYWWGYDDPTWVDEADLNCGALLHEFLQDRAKQSRFQVMQSHEPRRRIPAHELVVDADESVEDPVGRLQGKRGGGYPLQQVGWRSG
ncbi:hypothetical protein PR003_g27156 [Phytophthora rubi]|uniref:Chromo domain-containing protein n=1 Tax=Phytophthora rubi TaxID=129364 RepID=A0A6A4C2J9_9STRA|nr:hypothetical protein PR001_g22235 [Phytophthora rubi]KAE9283312.1 hypothetical protein PR003_g27156 [Phytophthora rubi]